MLLSVLDSEPHSRYTAKLEFQPKSLVFSNLALWLMNGKVGHRL